MATDHVRQENLGHVVFIAASAAMGGFLFGYDSSVINGAVVGIQHHFQVGPVEIGVVVAIALLGSAMGAWIGGRARRPVGADQVDAGGGDPVRRQLDRADAPVRRLGPGLLAAPGGVRDRDGLRARARLHRRGGARPPTGAGWARSSSSRSCSASPVSQLVNYVLVRLAGRRRQQRAVGAAGLAVDAGRVRRAGPALPAARLGHSRVAPLSRHGRPAQSRLVRC